MNTPSYESMEVNWNYTANLHTSTMASGRFTSLVCTDNSNAEEMLGRPYPFSKNCETCLKRIFLASILGSSHVNRKTLTCGPILFSSKVAFSLMHNAVCDGHAKLSLQHLRPIHKGSQPTHFISSLGLELQHEGYPTPRKPSFTSWMV